MISPEARSVLLNNRRQYPLGTDQRSRIDYRLASMQTKIDGEINLHNGNQFTSEQTAELQRKGMIVYRLNGYSIHDFQQEGMRNMSIMKGHGNWEGSRSRISEVAIDPQSLILKSSTGKTLEEQMELLDKYNDQLRATGQGLQAVQGSVADWYELAFMHLHRTGLYLFDRPAWICTRTTDAFKFDDSGEHNNITFGPFRRNDVPYIERETPGSRRENVGLAPLIIPSQ